MTAEKMREKLNFPRMFTGKGKTSDWQKAEVFPGRLRSFFFGGRVAAISGAGESPRERLSVGTDSPDSDEQNTRGVG